MKPNIGTKFLDNYNQTWTYIGKSLVQREDGMVGLWDKGRNLRPKPLKKQGSTHG